MMREWMWSEVGMVVDACGQVWSVVSPTAEARQRGCNAAAPGLIRGHLFASERSGSDTIHGCLRRTLLQLRLVGIA